MKIKIKVEYVLALSLGLSGKVMFGHDVPVHRKITQHAADSAFANSFAYKGFLDTISTDCDKPTAVQSMVEGSAREDDPTEGSYWPIASCAAT
jgi:hypothetical protein